MKPVKKRKENEDVLDSIPKRKRPFTMGTFGTFQTPSPAALLADLRAAVS